MKVALLEIGTSHDECLYSQIKFIKSEKKYHLTLIANNVLADNIKNYDLVDKINLIDVGEGTSQLLNLWKLRNKLISEKFDKVIINTAQSGVVKNLMLMPFPKKIEFIGVLHNTKKLIKSFSQKLISRKIKKYFVLSDYLLEKSKSISETKFKFESFYPIYFPQHEKVDLKKLNSEIWIAIPGNIEFKRRDYLSLFDSIDKFGLNKNIKFILLGNINNGKEDSKIIKNKIQSMNLKESFVTFNSYVDIDTYYSYLEYSDFILPLIHIDPNKDTTYKYRISGAFNLAFGFKLPLIMENYFKEFDDFKDNSIFYSPDNMIEIINNIKISKTNVYTENKWDFEFQKHKYLKFIES